MRVLVPGSTTVPFVAGLSSHGAAPALVTPEGTLSYGELAGRVQEFAARLGTGRRLVLLTGGNDVDTVVAYLACLAARHPVILVPGDNPANLAAVEAAYRPDLTVRGGAIAQHHEGSIHDLHPDLALLLSTSGSTGSPKLVRLSGESLQANADAIADYLAIRGTDVAATTLPMHYCYGLSVLNSHLTRGAAVVLTGLSVVDACFWDLCRSHQVTTFAGVPYTFDLLDRIGFDRIELPTLRYLTQAGGRMSAEQVRRYAALGQRRGFDLFVMYGQTEATARMAYLPPDLAATHPEAIGVPIPGGHFDLVPFADEAGDQAVYDDAVGELVYTGANVMLGYAEAPADLASGRTVHTLHTGDVARRTPEGLYQVIGRRSRFAKIFGLRIDLDSTERTLGEAGIAARCAEDDGTLVVAVQGEPELRARTVVAVTSIAEESWGLPPGALRILVLEELPRLASGKPDYRVIVALPDPGPAEPAPVPTGSGTNDLCRLYAELLGREQVTEEDSFVSLRGDSLSYVEMSVRLEELLGHLPAGWHLTPIRDLAPATRRRGRWLRSIETNVLLRTVAIVAIVGSHGNLFVLLGGAHLLLAIAGFNYARFQLTGAPRGERLRKQAGSIARIVVPSVLWIGGVALLTGAYPWRTALLLNGATGPLEWTEPAWHFWFIEALVALLLLGLVLSALPWWDRLERRWPFWLPVALSVVALLSRYEIVVLRGGDVIHRAHILLWLFALGWAIARASSPWHRLLLSALVVVTVPGFFEDPAREAVVIAGMLLLTWVPQVRIPAVLTRVVATLASASLYIYLAHWQVYPHLEDDYPLLAVTLSLLAGVLVAELVSRSSARLSLLRRWAVAR
ncbi:AMP-binding protein [Nocardioides sp.]|uniref:AMP-binding protein n=1 Tax=Nocardioides sp. TaxID=35761 RepID=UPI002735D206|nr:AMP-binding protein [Nocardioides sp.]MDP3892824.1 AMP-binding protein [Nocardioides sp.]